MPLRWKIRNSDVIIALRCSSKPSECLAHKPADVGVEAIQGGTVSLGSKTDTACDAFTLPHSNFHGASCLVTWFSPSDSSHHSISPLDLKISQIRESLNGGIEGRIVGALLLGRLI